MVEFVDHHQILRLKIQSIHLSDHSNRKLLHSSCRRTVNTCRQNTKTLHTSIVLQLHISIIRNENYDLLNETGHANLPCTPAKIKFIFIYELTD